MDASSFLEPRAKAWEVLGKMRSRWPLGRFHGELLPTVPKYGGNCGPQTRTSQVDKSSPGMVETVETKLDD